MSNYNSDSSQLNKYAEDLQKIYISEKKKRAELEEAHKQLKKYAKDLKRTISKLEISNKKLMNQVELEEREKLIERKLIQANKMTSLGTMASGIAHEINNPVSFLQGNTQMLIDIWGHAESYIRDLKDTDVILGGLSLAEILDDVPRMLKGNLEGTNRISSIIAGLKDYTANPSEVDHEKVQLNKAIRFSVSLLERKIKLSSVKLILQLEENLTEVNGIPQQFEQVIINLLQNSLNAIGTGKGEIHIKSYYNKISDSVNVKIMDNGHGIGEDILPRVTEPFFTTSRARGGTGLGLYISYSIMKQHHGTLDISSNPGKGTTVTLSIPVKKEIHKNGR